MKARHNDVIGIRYPSSWWRTMTYLRFTPSFHNFWRKWQDSRFDIQSIVVHSVHRFSMDEYHDPCSEDERPAEPKRRYVLLAEPTVFGKREDVKLFASIQEKVCQQHWPLQIYVWRWTPNIRSSAHNFSSSILSIHNHSINNYNFQSWLKFNLAL